MPSSASQAYTKSSQFKDYWGDRILCKKKNESKKTKSYLHQFEDRAPPKVTILASADEALKQKKLDLRVMNDSLLRDRRCEGVVTKRFVKQNFVQIYRSQLEIVIKVTRMKRRRLSWKRLLSRIF